jgi:diguanylate cyclase (GGDEF)-like protein/PAS domain S-box-containing protein
VWHLLIANLAVVMLFISVWANAQHFLEMRSRHFRNTVFSLLMGAGALASMSLSVEITPGVIFDLRTTFVAIAAFFAGPLGALIAGAMATAFRLALGGSGAAFGLIGIVFSAAFGLGFHWYARGRKRTLLQLLVFAAGIGLATAGSLTLLPAAIIDQVFQSFVPVVGVLTFFATFLAGYALLRSRQFSVERRLLRAAVAQAPDYFYVKDTRSQFVAVNEAVARLHGFVDPADMQGKSDFDISPPEQARIHYEAEQRVMLSGEPFTELEEQLTDSAGNTRWYSTSKSALRDYDGNVIGLAGVTHDITERRRLEEQAVQTHSLVSFALKEMSDGLAMFDRHGYLVLCNQRYSDSFPLTGHVRRPGAHIRDILEAVVASGEQLGVPKDNPAGWIDQIEASLKRDSEEEVSFADGRWLHIRTRPTQDGSSLVVVSDVTTIKKAELALVGITDQLKELATTDGLTGLLNRRSFDQVIDGELSRTGRERQPLSLLMIDVDRFKAYNDRYGHQAGDKCLKLVANCLREAALRPGDSLARYGGEEFVAILPNTDEDGAYIIAERLRKGLHDLRLPHEGSEKGIVTVSIGIASYPGNVIDRRDTELLRRSDEALYDAKAAGRDRVTGWRGTHEVLPRRIGAGTRKVR